jgi:ribosomal protein S18 acetylase RimI-like enzyme
MNNIDIIKYWDESTIKDYEYLRNIAYKENIDDNILVGTVQSPKYNLYLIYKDWNCVWFGGYNVSKKEPLSHNYTIENLYIKKELQWQWLMWILYEFMENEILNDGNKLVRLESKVTETNEKSLKFFKKHWFYQYWFAKNRLYDKNNNKYLWTILLEKII